MRRMCLCESTRKSSRQEAATKRIFDVKNYAQQTYTVFRPNFEIWIYSKIQLWVNGHIITIIHLSSLSYLSRQTWLFSLSRFQAVVVCSISKEFALIRVLSVAFWFDGRQNYCVCVSFFSSSSSPSSSWVVFGIHNTCFILQICESRCEIHTCRLP